MSFIYSRALVEAFSPDNCSDTDASAPLSGSPTPRPCLWHDKTMEHSRLSRFGMTCAHLTEGRGAELLMSFAVGFPAKTSAQPGMALESTESEAGYGAKWQGSFARYDRRLSKWKTVQCSLLEGLDEFSETWPRWGSMRNGVSYLRRIPALPICESASGLWQTPVADDAVNRKAGKWNSRGEPKLSAEVMLWPTPVASMSKGSSPAALTRRDGQDRSNDRLDHAVMASDGGQLNPDWVEWLMGWPIGHTDLKPLATGRFHEWQQQHGRFSGASNEP